MRLLQIKPISDASDEPQSWNIRLVEPPIDDIPPYAILSHTWGDGEVTFDDMKGDPAVYKAKKGCYKIEATCKQAKQHGLSYAWCDSCCIDKSSSAELSEAINSMYAWYAAAARCYAYMVDVYHVQDGTDNSEIHSYQFETSRWWSRGWTLQELLAPRDVQFFDRDWLPVGTKRDHADHLEKITGIESQVLLSTKSMNDVSVARRMSRAAPRQTTRIEDIAYCLLGLFDVSSPLIYGEGKRAFFRLQEEIIKTSDDQSIFAWGGFAHQPNKTYPLSCPLPTFESGLLAAYPKHFSGSRNVETFRDWTMPTESFSLTNAGLSIRVRLRQFKKDHYFAYLNCITEGSQVVLILKCVSETAGQFVRVVGFDDSHWGIDATSQKTTPENTRRILVRQETVKPKPWDLLPACSVIVDFGIESPQSDGYYVSSSIEWVRDEPVSHSAYSWERRREILLHNDRFRIKPQISVALWVRSAKYREEPFVVLVGTKSPSGFPIPYLKALSVSGQLPLLENHVNRSLSYQKTGPIAKAKLTSGDCGEWPIEGSKSSHRSVRRIAGFLCNIYAEDSSHCAEIGQELVLHDTHRIVLERVNQDNSESLRLVIRDLESFSISGKSSATDPTSRSRPQKSQALRY